MVVGEKIRKDIEKNAELYNATKEKIKARIETSIRVAVERLEAIKSELLDEVDREFGKNPFAEFLSYGNNRTDIEAEELLTKQKIPENFGPDEKSFYTLLKGIDSFGAWRNKPNPLDFIPKGLKADNVTCDSATLSWDAVSSDCVYEIELRSSTSPKSIIHSGKPEYALYDLKPGTGYHIRVRAIFFHKGMECMWSNPVMVKTKSLSVINVSMKTVSWNEIEVSWETDDECDKEVKYTVNVRKEGEKCWKEAKSELTDGKCKVGGLEAGNVYEVRVKCVAKGGTSVGEWSDIVRGKTMKTYGGVWKKCPSYVCDNRKYNVSGENSRTVSNGNYSGYYHTIIGDTPITLSVITLWSIKVLKSMNNGGGGILVGVAPNDINQNTDNCNYCGWYFYCYESALYSGPPHKYYGKGYGPRKENGEYVHTGDSVGVLMDTTKGDLSFVLNGVNHGAAYEGIPLDKPLVPCVLLRYQGDSVELVVLNRN